MIKDDEISRLKDAKFSIVVILLSMFISSSIGIFLYFYRQRKKILIDQHLTLILVILCFMDMTTNYPTGLYENRYRRAISSTINFCLSWNWWVYSLTTALVWVSAFSSIQQHIFIFHNTMMATKKRRFFFPYSSNVHCNCFLFYILFDYYCFPFL